METLRGARGGKSQGVNGLAGELLAKGSIDELMLFDPCEITKALGHNGDLQVITAPGEVLDLNLRIRQGLADRRRHSIGLNHELP